MGSSDTFTPKVCTVVDAISHPTCSHDGSWSLSRLENGTKFVSHHIASNRHEYFKLLQVPCPEQMQHIRAIQELKETENSRRINKISFPDQQWLSSQNEFNKDSYPKSMINQMSLSPSDKLVEAAREVYYRKLTGPFARKDEEEGLREAFKKVDMENNEMSLNIKALMARQRWIKVGLILRRAGRDQDSNVEEVDRNLEIQSQKKQKRKQMTRRNINLEYRKKTKAMDVHYFLEMIDIKHRYGPNLRIYHEEWKKSRTLDNFFLWLDFGEGSIISCQACPRQRLERERVRYLSTEERRNYLVYIDRNGRLCWAKNGAHVDTSEKYCDSVNGIIPVTNQITKSPYSTTEFLQDNTVKEDYDAVPIFLTSLYSLNDGKSNEYDDQIHHFSTQKISRLHQVRDMKKVRHISAATIINRLLRESVKKNTWIFVADTSFRLYVGIKKSGVFQHSSFLRGGRISAAGSIRVEDGRLSRLSPLSGHYRPPITNFRTFILALKESGVDMSSMTISHTCAILLGLEIFGKSRRTAKQLLGRMAMNQGELLASHVSKGKKDPKSEKSFISTSKRKLMAHALMSKEIDRARKPTNNTVNYLRGMKPTFNCSHCGKALPLRPQR